MEAGFVKLGSIIQLRLTLILYVCAMITKTMFVVALVDYYEISLVLIKLLLLVS